MHARRLWVLLVLLALPALAQDPDPAAGPDPEPFEDPEPTPAPTPGPAPALDATTPLGDLRAAYGEARPAHWIDGTEDQIRQGREITLQGRTTGPNGRRSPRVSLGYQCTHCHQVEREDPDLRVADPDARLDYAIERDMTFLPGTTLWGIANRRSWFNEDYIKKYGDLVKPANASLVEALQLCAAECSQGRLLEDWEVEALLAYFGSIQVTVGDLDLDDAQRDTLARAQEDSALHADALAILDGAMLPYAPAHALEPVSDRSKGPDLAGRPDRGQALYERSCLSCHARPGPGTYGLGPGKASIAELYRNRADTSNLGFHQTIRYGTRPYGVPLAYMPFYTAERLSDQGLADLVSYFEQVLGKGAK
jgi:mono/diheme cytochrome c family protein